MSGLRNAIPRRPHRERAQPHSRARHGLLEKHKDYSARARDFKAKQTRLKTLRTKATDRNPDEFSFGMLRGSTNGGVKLASRGNQSFSNDVVKLMKTQDAGYLRMMVGKTRRERERLEGAWCAKENGDVVALGGEESGNGRHTVFVDGTQDLEEFEAEKWLSPDDAGLAKRYNRPKVDVEEEESSTPAFRDNSRTKKTAQRVVEAKQSGSKEQMDAERRRAIRQESRVAKLEAIKNRERELLLAADELDRQRARISNSIGGVNKNGMAFKVRRRNP